MMGLWGGRGKEGGRGTGWKRRQGKKMLQELMSFLSSTTREMEELLAVAERLKAERTKRKGRSRRRVSQGDQLERLEDGGDEASTKLLLWRSLVMKEIRRDERYNLLALLTKANLLIRRRKVTCETPRRLEESGNGETEAPTGNDGGCEHGRMLLAREEDEEDISRPFNPQDLLGSATASMGSIFQRIESTIESLALPLGHAHASSIAGPLPPPSSTSQPVSWLQLQDRPADEEVHLDASPDSVGCLRVGEDGSSSYATGMDAVSGEGDEILSQSSTVPASALVGPRRVLEGEGSRICSCSSCSLPHLAVAVPLCVASCLPLSYFLGSRCAHRVPLSADEFSFKGSRGEHEAEEGVAQTWEQEIEGVEYLWERPGSDSIKQIAPKTF
eukprot:766963-Hanusia_phi.AAC.10